MKVSFLTTLPTLKACNSPYMQYYFKRFFILHSSEVIFSFLIKKSRQKTIEIETAFFHSLGNPKGRILDRFFYASHISHNFSYKLIPISMSQLMVARNVCVIASSVSSLCAIVYYVTIARYYVCLSALVKGTRFRFVHQVYSLIRFIRYSWY